jgi:hypothetical protein
MERTIMKSLVSTLLLLLLLFPVASFAQKAAIVQQDKSVDFSKFKTYSYEVGQPALRSDVDKQIVAGIEAKLAALGLTKAASGPGDIIVTYYAVERQDVDIKTFDSKEPPKGELRQPATVIKIGTLVVDAKLGASRKVAWRVKAEGALGGDMASAMKAIDQAVADAFALYPGVKK